MKTDVWIGVFRSVAWLLALGMLVFSFFDSAMRPAYELFAGQSRYLTQWALVLALVCWSILLLHQLKIVRAVPRPLIAVSSVAGAMVILLYWGLLALDAEAVRSVLKIPLYHDIYMHALGPVLLLIEAAFISRCFNALRQGVCGTVVLVGAYVIWIEAVLQQFGAIPAGTITSGLPYPFLNDLSLWVRLSLYLGLGFLAIGLYGLAYALTAATDKKQR